MKTYAVVIAVFLTSLFPLCAQAAGGASMSTVGAGANGYDWFVGTWNCTNTMPASKLGSLPVTTLTATKLKNGSIFFHTASPNGDVTGYYKYDPTTKTWLNPFSDSSGYFGYESSQQSGKTMQFNGMFYMTSADPVPIRDTFTMLNMRKQYDVSESKVGGAWKTVAKITCTKS